MMVKRKLDGAVDKFSVAQTSCIATIEIFITTQYTLSKQSAIQNKIS